MKQTIYIESIEYKENGGWVYASINQNAEWIYKAMKFYSVSCEAISQFSDSYWRLEIKGRKKNVKAFIAELTCRTASLYNVRTYSSSLLF